jgi:hypothetical protein
MEALRAATSLRPAVQNVRISMRDRRTGKAFDGRGAVAVRRDHDEAVRMILLGPGGTTALDVWLTRDAYRLAIPAIDLVRRGRSRVQARDSREFSENDAKAPDEAPPPIGFLRWWFLAPFEGRLLAAVRDEPGVRDAALILREPGGATVVLREANARATRAVLKLDRTGGETGACAREDLRIDGELFGPGAHVTYANATLGVNVDVVVESVSADEPDPAAFVDPDAPVR